MKNVKVFTKMKVFKIANNSIKNKNKEILSINRCIKRTRKNPKSLKQKMNKLKIKIQRYQSNQMMILI